MNQVEAETYDHTSFFYVLRGDTTKGFKDSYSTDTKDITVCLEGYNHFEHDPEYWVTTKLIIPEVFL